MSDPSEPLYINFESEFSMKEVKKGNTLSKKTLVMLAQNTLLSHVNNLRSGQNVILEEIVKKMSKYRQIKDFKVLKPLEDVPVKDNQFARCGDNKMTVKITK